MPLPNGVDPRGRIHPICPSANFLGNRGILHGDDGVITKPWKNKSWVTCDLHYGGRNRKPLMQPNRYSELFFLDEATSLAAGHRPCGECRNDAYKRFKHAWAATHTSAELTHSIGEIDKALHDERTTLTKEKKTFSSPLGRLPFGVMFELDELTYLHWHNRPLKWSASGYEPSEVKFNDADIVEVLTPASIVSILRAGYVSQVPSSTMESALI